jgi:hypothetical protein
MTPRSGTGAPSAGALRMRRSRARLRRGDVSVKLEIGQRAITRLVALGWVTSTDYIDKDALTGALVELVERAIAMRVTPSTESEGACSTPVYATAGSLIAIGSESAPRTV